MRRPTERKAWLIIIARMLGIFHVCCAEPLVPNACLRAVKIIMMIHQLNFILSSRREFGRDTGMPQHAASP
jgi:hypothetical protein